MKSVLFRIGIVGGCVLASLSTEQVSALEVPLTVSETSGADRMAHPVNSGIPLPEGAVNDVAALRVLDAQGQPVLASIEPRARWLTDKSLKWVSVHFLADLSADETVAFTLAVSDEAAPSTELLVEESDRAITVTTGPAKFVVPTDRFAPFDQVYVRETSDEAFSDDHALLTEPGRVVLTGRNGLSRVVPRTGEHEKEFRTELVRIDEETFTQTAVVESTEVEERGPGRVVVKIAGTFTTPEVTSLDFAARLYFYSSSDRAELTFSVRNRQMDSMAHFVAIERLGIELKLRTAGDAVVRSGIDGKTVEATEGVFTQTDPDRCEANGSEAGRKWDGWICLESSGGGVTAGTRWSWQVHPVGAAAGKDGSVILDLKSADGERVDLYTSGAKTRFLFFDFGRGKEAEPAALAKATTDPLFALCDPNWYCQETRVFGDIYANNQLLYKEEYRDVIATYQDRIDGSLNQIVDQRARPGWTVDEFGWLDFGSGLHHRTKIRENEHESWWDSNYYDFPHAALVNFLRTGDLINLTTAFEAGLHLADLDICHSVPGSPELAGSPRSGPVVGHFRDYNISRGQEFAAHTSFTFYKNESLYELYYLTGERWFRDVGLMSSEFAMAHWGKGALRNVAHGIWGVLSAYRDTHEQRFLDRAEFFVDEWAKPWQDEHNGSFDDQLWMYGLQFEAYDKYYRLSGDQETARYNLRAIDALIEEEKGGGRWKPTTGLPGINLCGYLYAYDYTGDEKYLKQGLDLLEQTTSAGGTRVKTFAQQFRASPYFLKALTVGYTPSGVLAND